MLSRTLGVFLPEILDMDSSVYETYKAEYARCPWDQSFKQTKDTYEEAPDLNALMKDKNG